MLLFAFTIFLSAFLLFSVQPVIAKLILPWFGGAASVWITCMLFFQAALLAGYMYSHFLADRLAPRKQAVVHGLLLAASLLLLPIVPGESWKPAGGGNPGFEILALLAVCVGLPYFVLSTTGPLVQAWYARTYHHSTPYRLYALSNAGSLIALLGYPVLVEPVLGTRKQAMVWSAAYAVFVLVCGALSWRAAGRPPAPREQAAAGHGDGPRTSRLLPLLWMALAACASTLLLAVTNHLTQDVAAAPFLWLLPLSLYLLSFILCFEREGWYMRMLFLPLTAVALCAMVYMLGDYPHGEARVQVVVLAAALFVCCMSCHGELASLKPHPSKLTWFYLMVALGGAVGGVFVGLIAPLVFPLYFEFPVGIVACGLLVTLANYLDKSSPLHRVRWGWSWMAVAAFLAAVSGFLIATEREELRGYRVLARNFYGVLRTSDEGEPSEENYTRKLLHGGINHGEQRLQPGRRHEPTTYYGYTSGIGLAMERLRRQPSLRAGLVGLGAGVMLSYGRAGDYYRVYEINPLALQVASTEFTFLRDCPAKVDVVLGDARLSLEKDAPQNFDVLFVDAFSGDSVPVHLLTREAITLYFRHLKENGILVLHISNKYVSLEPVVEQAAKSLDKDALLVDDDPEEDTDLFGSTMALLAARNGILKEPCFRDRGKPLSTGRAVRLWTDDYSNLLGVMQ